MIRKWNRLVSVFMAVCFFVALMPSSAMADGCKWWGQINNIQLPNANEYSKYTITVNCDHSYSVDFKFDENYARPTSLGYVNNWVRLSTPARNTNQKLYLYIEKNYSGMTRKCTVTLTCNTHREKRTYIIKQPASTLSTPMLVPTLSKTTVRPGEQFKLSVTTKDARRLFADLMSSGLRTSNWSQTIDTAKKTYSITVTVPQYMTPGVYSIPIEVSNAAKSNDAWAKVVKKTVNIIVVNPVSAPVIKNANTGAIFAPNQTVDYSTSNGNLKLSWSAENGCGYYKTVMIGLNEVPDFGDSSQSARKVYSCYSYSKTAVTSVTIPVSTMKKAAYMKIAIGAYSNKNDAAPVKWTNVGLKIVSRPDGKYNVQKAIDYAYTYAKVHCTISSHQGGDCAHFTAQCSDAGGIKVKNSSTYYSSTTLRLNGLPMGEYRNPYIASGAQLKWFYDEGFEVIEHPSQSQMNIGDLICTTGSGGVNDGHIMIITGYNKTYGYTACGHTTYRKDFPIGNSATYLIKLNYSNAGLVYHENVDFSAY